MKDDWSKAMLQRLRMARQDPPTAAALLPQARKSAARAASLTAARGGRASVHAEATRTRLIVHARGPAAGQALALTREDLARQRRMMVDAVKAEAQRKLKGMGR